MVKERENREPWTPKEISDLQEKYPSDKYIIEEIEKELPGRNRNSIRLKANELGLYRPIPDVPEELDMSRKLITRNVTNSVYYILKEIKLIISIDRINSPYVTPRPPELVTNLDTNLDQVGKILSTQDLRRMAWYFLDQGAATVLVLQNRLGLSYAASYRYLNDLKASNLIVPAIKIRSQKGKKGGPKPDIWMVPDATIDMINEAQALHRRLISPKYVAGEKLGQLILEEYLSPKQATEITGREVWAVAREKGIRGELSDIVEFAMNYLQFEKGIKVWR